MGSPDLTPDEESGENEENEDYGNFSDDAQNAITRMKRAHDRGTGCHLTADMIQGLGYTFMGEMWDEPDPRSSKKPQKR